MKWDEQRDLLRAKAAEDAQAMTVLAAAPGTSDTTVGFHAQQAVEKYLKAALCHCHVDYARIHDLVVLLDALTDAGHPPPAEVDKCKYLQPYAVQFRYDYIPVGGQGALDRVAVQRDVGRVGDWISQVMASETQRP